MKGGSGNPSTVPVVRGEVEFMIVYDNEALRGFRSGWGFSCYIKEKGILFDTGADLDNLMYNMEKLSIHPKEIKKIVLSHEHGDHTGGIGIVEYCGDVEVFILRSFSKWFKERLASYPNVNIVEVEEEETVCDDVFTTGELGLFTKEQSLIIETEKGVVVVTGCSHPGLESILAKAKKFGRVYGVIGGFHGFSKLGLLKEMSLIVPCHCTARKKEILNLYPKTSVRCSAGFTIRV